MSEEQLSALLSKLKEDAGLQEKLRASTSLDAAVGMAQAAGFDVCKADWLKHQARQTLELSDEELEALAGGESKTWCDSQHSNPCTCDAADWWSQADSLIRG